jgi:hypothetical protein
MISRPRSAASTRSRQSNVGTAHEAGGTHRTDLPGREIVRTPEHDRGSRPQLSSTVGGANHDDGVTFEGPASPTDAGPGQHQKRRPTQPPTKTTQTRKIIPKRRRPAPTHSRGRPALPVYRPGGTGGACYQRVVDNCSVVDNS